MNTINNCHRPQSLHLTQKADIACKQRLMYSRECDEFHGACRHVVAVNWQKSLINQETIISIVYQKKQTRMHSGRIRTPYFGPFFCCIRAFCLFKCTFLFPLPTPCKQTNTRENITFPQLRWRAVIEKNTVRKLVLMDRTEYNAGEDLII